MTALVMLAIARAPASHWHQRCARLSVIAKKTLCFWNPQLPLLLCVTTGVQLYFSSDLGWSVMADEFQDIEEIC